MSRKERNQKYLTPTGACPDCPYRISIFVGNDKVPKAACTLRIYDARGKGGVVTALSARKKIPLRCTYFSSPGTNR